jgi:hypothetical protein
MTPLAAARLSVGLAQVALPDRVGGTAFGHQPDERERTVVRVLGVRHLAQYVADARGHRLLGGPTLDVLHAASMVGLAMASRRYRRAALTSAVVASAFAAGAAVRG